jgi:hypothetical protein
MSRAMKWRLVRWLTLYLLATLSLLYSVMVGGCQARTVVTGAQSRAERVTEDNRGFEEWTIEVVPPADRKKEDTP